MFDFYRNFKPLSYSVLLHVLILGVFTVSLSSDPVVRPMPAVPEIIQAEALDEAQVLQEVERLKENENKQRAAEKSRKRALEKKLRAEEKRLKLLKKERLKEEKRIKDQQSKSAKATEKEKKALAALKKQKQKALREKAALKKSQDKQKAALAKLKKEKVALERKKKAAEAKRKAKAEAKRKRIARQKYEESEITRAMIRIERQVKRNWTRPSAISNGLTCTIRVQLIAGGQVKSAQVIESSGNAIFDRSAENAVRKASPLPVPTDPLIFQKFKVFSFIFNPQ